MLEFVTKWIVFHYRPNVAEDRHFLPKTAFGHLVGKESDRTLYHIFVPSLSQIEIRSKNEFIVLKSDTNLPSFDTLTDG